MDRNTRNSLGTANDRALDRRTLAQLAHGHTTLAAAFAQAGEPEEARECLDRVNEIRNRLDDRDTDRDR